MAKFHNKAGTFLIWTQNVLPENKYPLLFVSIVIYRLDSVTFLEKKNVRFQSNKLD